MGVPSLARPDLAAHRRAIQAPFPAIVKELAEILGKKLTAYIGGVKDTRVVERWMEDGVEPYRDADRRIRLAYQIAKREWRRPISLSRESWPGVTFTAPVPNSRSTWASAMMGICRPVSGRSTIFPTIPV